MTSRDSVGGGIPIWTWAAPLVAFLMLGGFYLQLLPEGTTFGATLAALVLGACVFASVHHAEVIALRVGEPFGSIVLAIAVTVIEVALIVSIMVAAKQGSESLARDTVFATVMIVLNGIVGLCLLLGGARHHQQNFSTDAATAALSVLGTLAGIALVLPSYTETVPGPYYSKSQLIFVSMVSMALYAVFLFVQTHRHRDYFLSADEINSGVMSENPSIPSPMTSIMSLCLLAAALTAVVLLAKTLSPALEAAVESAGLPKKFVGVVIATIVLMPEGLAAIRAAQLNRLQTSLNLALGSAMATIGMTIPLVALAALLLGQHLSLGIGTAETIMLLLTLFIGTVSLATGRTTILQGSVHLVIFAVFIFLTAVP